MATSKNAKVEFESGQSVINFTAMTDGGDHKVFTLSGATVFSGQSGFEADIRPNGIINGRNLLSANATANKVTVGAFTAQSKGVIYAVDATEATIVRAATDVAKICSICMDEDGVIEVVEGADSASTAFSEVRGAAGGPPSIPIDSVELGQVRVATNASGLITADEILQTPGTHTERADYPVFSVNNIGDGDDADTPAKKNAYVEFSAVLPTIHGATATSAATGQKKTYTKAYTPLYVIQPRTYDFVPADKSFSVSSQQVYDETVGSVSSTLGQCQWSALMNDNITDALLQQKNKVITVKHYPDKNKAAYTLQQGTLGVGRTFPAGSQNKATCTLSCERASVGFSS